MNRKIIPLPRSCSLAATFSKSSIIPALVWKRSCDVRKCLCSLGLHPPEDQLTLSDFVCNSGKFPHLRCKLFHIFVFFPMVRLRFFSCKALSMNIFCGGGKIESVSSMIFLFCPVQVAVGKLHI